MKRKLRIAMFFSADPKKIGGVQEHVYNLVNQLTKFGHQVFLFGPENNCLRFKNYQAIGYSIDLPLPNGNLGNLIIPFNNKEQIFKKIFEKEFDIYHLHEPYIPMIPWEIIKEKNTPKVVSFHSAWENDSFWKILTPIIPFFKKQFSQSFKAAIFVSKVTRKRWQSVCSRQVWQRVIHNGVDEMFFINKRKLKKELIKILFLGRLVARKGPLLLVEAIEKLSKLINGFHLDIIGDGKERNTITHYINKRRLHQKISLWGEIKGKKRLKFFQQADVFCAPYADEAFSIAVLEAIACGLTVVGFKIEAFKEIFSNYPNKNLFVTSGNVDKLTRVLKEAVINDGLRQEISRWNLREREKYHWNKIAGEIERLYYEVIT